MGQLGVAIGRATSKDGLQVQNYNSFAGTLKHPTIVKDFYSKAGEPMKLDLSCCKRNLDGVEINDLPRVLVEAQQENMLSESANTSENMDANTSMTSNFPYDIEDFITGELF